MAIGFGLTRATIDTTLKQPFEYEAVPYKIEAFRRAASGRGRKDVIATVRRWRVGWRNLTYTQWRALYALWEVNAPLHFQDLEGNTYLVLIVSDMQSPAEQRAGGTHHYAVAWDLEWVGVSDEAGIFTLGISLIGGPDVLYGLPGAFTLGQSLIGGDDGLTAV